MAWFSERLQLLAGFQIKGHYEIFLQALSLWCEVECSSQKWTDMKCAPRTNIQMNSASLLP